MARFRERNIRDYWRTILATVLLIAGVLFALLVLRERTPTIVVVLFLFALFWAVVGLLSRSNGYRCANCRKVFRVPTTVNFFTPSGVSKNPDGTYYAWKSLTCPHCGQRTKAKVLKRADLRGDRALLDDRRLKKGGGRRR
jgi:hypothetical protein